jgi:hypothetical protein
MSIDTSRKSPRIMGGMFGFPEVIECSGRYESPIRLDNTAFLANGRCALFVLINILKPKRVWLPAYLCPSIIQAVQATGVPIRYMTMTYDLQIAPGELDDIGEGDLLDIIDYFGFYADRELMKKARAAGAWVLEDACQAMLTRGVGDCADFSLFTPRKYVGIPDAGILVSHRKDIDLTRVELSPPPAHWWMLTFSAAVLRREFDIHGGDRSWFKQYQELEEDMPLGPYSMSDMSRMLLTSTFDYADNARRRIENYGVLQEHLADLALYPELPQGVVPLGFPVRLANRDEMQKILFAADIFPPVHWPFPGILPAEFTESYRLRGSLMMLPCDQRCGESDMRRMIGLLKGKAIPAPK